MNDDNQRLVKDAKSKFEKYRYLFNFIRWRLGRVGAVVATATFVAGLVWWKWPDIEKRPGVATLVSRLTRPPVAPPQQPTKTWKRADEAGQLYLKTFTVPIDVGARRVEQQIDLDVENARIYDIDFRCSNTRGNVNNCDWNYIWPPCEMQKAQQQAPGANTSGDHALCARLINDGRAFVWRRWEENGDHVDYYTVHYEVYR